MLSRKLSWRNKILSLQVACLTLGSLLIGFAMGFSYKLERETSILWVGFALALVAVFLPLLSVIKPKRSVINSKK
jgi:predicted MFS family arabinose efflux permease